MHRLPRSPLLLLALALGVAGCGRTIPWDRPHPLPDGGGVDAPLPADGGPPCTSDVDCDDGIFCNGAEVCLSTRCMTAAPIFCDDGLACTVDRCDEMGRTCTFEPRMVDADGDGSLDIACGGDDCDDTNPLVGPGVMERCRNGIDDDCDGLVDCEDVTACAPDPACSCTPTPELCGNGVDDDCDFLRDCEDPDCFSDPGCVCVPSPEMCANGADDDCDGLVDCADPECDDQPECCTPAPEVCDNGRDDDCDGLVDCADPICSGSPTCVPPCPESDLGSAIGDAVATGSTVGRTNTLGASCAGGAASPDITFRWAPPHSGRYVFDTIGSGYDTALHVHGGSCAGAEIACDDDAGGSLTSKLTVTLRAGTVVVITVDGFGTASAGDYVLNIHEVEPEAGNCDDGDDNDRDGLTDCADPDCSTDPACARPCPDLDIGAAVGPAVWTGTTVGARNDLTPGCAVSTAPDVALSWTAPRSARYRFDTNGSAFDTVLYIRDGACLGPELACNDDVGGTLTSRITRNVTGGTRLILVVDGAGTASGLARLNITAFEAGFCADSIDNDLDGRTDCADTECAALPACCVPMLENCFDGADNDCDTLVDCADPNCASSPACCTPMPERCSNGADDDCDGLIDCVDPDCRLSPVC